jgi:hypothetical protein
MTTKKPPFEIGSHIGDWEVIAQVEQTVVDRRGQRREFSSRVRCVCGTEKILTNNYLRAGSSTSCGCRRGQALAMSGVTHNKSYSDNYKLWSSIKYRLKNLRSYSHVHMHEAWVNDFEAFDAFIATLGPKSTPQHSLDRIDPAGHYVPGNLRWADKTTQSLNRRCSMVNNLIENSVVKVGQKYDMLTVLEVVIENRHGRNWYGAKVRCECGTIKNVYQKQLLSPKTKSCGCFKNRNLRLGHKALEKPIEANGRSQSLSAWARELGVSVPVIWNRIHKYGWEPARAVTEPLHEEQCIEVNGERLTPHEWQKRHGVRARVILKRIMLGWEPARAVTEPVRAWARERELN